MGYPAKAVDPESADVQEHCTTSNIGAKVLRDFLFQHLILIPSIRPPSIRHLRGIRNRLDQDISKRVISKFIYIGPKIHKIQDLINLEYSIFFPSHLISVSSYRLNSDF